MKFLSQRLAPPPEWDHFVVQDSVENLIDEKDLKKYPRGPGILEEQVAEHRGASQRVDRIEGFQKVARRRGANNNRNGGRTKYLTVDNSPVRLVYPGGDLSQREAQMYCPAPVRLYRDPVNK